MTRPSDTPIEVLSDPRLEPLQAGIPDDPGAPGLAQLKDEYRRYTEQALYHRKELSRCNVVAGYRLETAMKRMRTAGLSWEEIRKELETWH